MIRHAARSLLACYTSGIQMNMSMAVLADGANVTREGKLNIFGIFSVLGAASFPAVHPQMQLVLGFEATKAEEGKTKEVEVQLMNADGKRVFALSGRLTIPTGESGYPPRMGHILALSGVRFEEPGDYSFHILVGGDEKGRVPLKIMRVAQEGRSS